MANHASANLPWAVDQGIMSLFAGRAMEAAFGGWFVRDDVGGGAGGADLSFRPALASMLGSSNTQVWSESERHVEMRHGGQGLGSVAQFMEFEALASCFGACVADDEGIGAYLLRRPGALGLLGLRGFAMGLASGPMSSSRFGLWGLRGEAMEAAKAKLDPMFFAERSVDPFAAPDEEYLRLKAIDVVHWAAKADWAGSVERAFPKGLSAKQAFSALLPSAALGVACPEAALASAGVAGLERALSVALLWSRPDPARQIHARLAQASPDVEASGAKALAQCEKFLARRARTKEGERLPDEDASAKALFESLAISVKAKAPAKGAPSKKTSI